MTSLSTQWSRSSLRIGNLSTGAASTVRRGDNDFYRIFFTKKWDFFLLLLGRSYWKSSFRWVQVRGCNNQMTAKGLHKHEGYNFCDWCHETLYAQREYGPGPGGETIEERRAREQRELEERERRLREIEEMRNKKVSGQCDS